MNISHMHKNAIELERHTRKFDYTKQSFVGAGFENQLWNVQQFYADLTMQFIIYNKVKNYDILKVAVKYII